MEGLGGSGAEGAGDLLEPLILSNLKVGDKPFLINTCEPHRDTVGEYGDNKCIVYFLPVQEVEPLNQVT